MPLLVRFKGDVMTEKALGRGKGEEVEGKTRFTPRDIFNALIPASACAGKDTRRVCFA